MTSSILRVQSCNCTVGLGLIVVLRLAPPPNSGPRQPPLFPPL